MSEQEVSDAKVATAKKILINLQSQDKKLRKQSLIDLQAFFADKDQAFSMEDLRNIFAEINITTLNAFRDKTEMVREQAIAFMTNLIIDILPINDYYLTYVCPVLVERIGSVEILEESEEIRLQLVTFLQAIILKYTGTEQLKPFLNDCIIILEKTVKDKHPAIKELSSKCIQDLAIALPHDFHLQAECLLKPLISCLTHQRFKVRVEAIKAIGVVVMHSSYNALNDSVGPLAEKLFDQIPIVRRTVAQVAYQWLTEYRDRYSFFHKILPLLLTGLNDEVEETRVEANELWLKVGLQYQQENEKDLKDQMDFLTQPPKYCLDNLARPNLGCRILVQRNIIKLAKALSMELTSWQEDVRLRCAQLLCSLALHAEESITQNLQDLLPAMYSAARDEDARVSGNIFQACQIIGLYVPPSTWMKLVLPAIEDGPHWGQLFVLNGLMTGSPSEYLGNCLQEISNLLADNTICFSRKKEFQLELVKCLFTISSKLSSSEKTDIIGFNLFKILIALIALRHPDNINIDNKLVENLGDNLGFSTIELWMKHTSSLLKLVEVEPKTWTTVTPQKCIFEEILMNSKQAFGQNLDLIADILVQSLHVDCDPEVRLKIFLALSIAFEKKEIIFEDAINLDLFFDRLIKYVFVPSLVWHAGITAEALRTMACSCLLSALTPISKHDLFIKGDDLVPLFNELIPLLISLMEDASYRSRMLAIECIIALKIHSCRLKTWTCENLIKIYPEVLKRLDDPSDKVRETALKSLSELLTEIPEEFKASNFRAHHELLIDTLLIHFDDDDDVIIDLVEDTLKAMVRVNIEELAKKLIRHKPLLRNQKGCDKLLEYLGKFKQ